MPIIAEFLFVILSAVVVLMTAEFALNSCIKIARHFRMSDEFVGMTLLSIGTSLPEIMTHIIGSHKILLNPGSINKVSGLVVGSNVGSDIFQQNFVLGLVALIGVIVVQKKDLIKDVGGLIVASALMFIFSYNGLISRIEGFLLFSGYIGYLYVLNRFGRKKSRISAKKENVLKETLIIVISFVIMSIAADIMLSHSIAVLKDVKISASFFGVFLLGIAAAFPELMASVLAIFKKKANISAGILIGSNITNPMLALGLGSLISTYSVPKAVVWFDLPIKIGTALLLLWYLSKGKLEKRNAIVLMTLYILYLLLRNTFLPVDVF